jgi:Alginate lyase
MAETERPSPDRHRRRLGLFVAAAVAVVLVGIALIGGSLGARSEPLTSSAPSPTSIGSLQASGGPSPASGGPPSTQPVETAGVSSAPTSASLGYLVLPADLADRASKAAQGVEPWQAAQQGLLSDVDAALNGSPHPKVSLNIPGTQGPFVDDTASAYGLALAYAVTGDQRYAVQARSYIMAWTSMTTRLVNACPDTGACQTSLIVGRVVAGFVFAADLIRPSGVMSGDDDTAFRAWLHDLILPNLSRRINNWGDTGDFSRAVITDYLGDRAGFDAALADWKTKMDLVAADGHIPEEVRRGTAGFSYTQEALQYKIGTARLAELRGVDLWSYVGKQGGSLDKAIGVLRTYWFQPAAWPWNSNVKIPLPGPMWEIAYQHFQDPAWPAVFAQERPFGLNAHSAIRWTTLTNGIAIP